jgi:hypothetical protein
MPVAYVVQRITKSLKESDSREFRRQRTHSHTGASTDSPRGLRIRLICNLSGLHEPAMHFQR